ncbi:protein yggM [Salmonella enterica subsp. enterica]|nr:protein yggM [Salmonella enterica subsp. enterica]
MVRQWIAGAALFALISGYSWAEVAQPSDNILKEQFSKQYHGILKLDSITLKNLDSRGNQATWSAEGDISSREDMYTGVGMAADYYFVEKPGPKIVPLNFLPC